MRRKIYALAAVLLIVTALREVLDRALRISGVDPSNAAVSTKQIVPGSVGPFHATRRWSSAAGWGREAGAIYRGPAGQIVSLDFLLGEYLPHDSVTCFLRTGETPLWRQVRTVRTDVGSATFDVAVFREAKQLRLIANTECDQAKCREYRPSFGALMLQIFPQNRLVAAGEPIIPVSIVIDAPLEKYAGISSTQSLLVERFDKFASGLDLNTVRRAASAEKIRPSTSESSIHERDRGNL